MTTLASVVLFSSSCAEPQAPANPSSLPNQPHISATNISYSPLEPITIQYVNFPGNQRDWITLVSSTAPSSALGEYFYLDGLRAGEIQFEGLPAGSYEARGYVNWPVGGYNVVSAYPVKVVGPLRPETLKKLKENPLVRTTKQIYRPGEPIIVKFSGFPQNENDWITVVPYDSPRFSEEQSYFLKGSPAGTLTFDGLAPGNYEVRAFFDWPAGKFNVQAHHIFVVSEDYTRKPNPPSTASSF